MSLTRLTQNVRVFKHFALLALGYMIALSASRLLLVSIYSERVAATDGVGFILLQGMRFDIILVGMFFGPVLMFMPWFHSVAILRRIGKWVFPES